MNPEVRSRVRVESLIATLGRLYDHCDDRGDGEGKQLVYDALLMVGAQIMSDGRWHPAAAGQRRTVTDPAGQAG